MPTESWQAFHKTVSGFKNAALIKAKSVNNCWQFLLFSFFY